MTLQDKEWIDKASYEDLLRRWRFATAGDPVFQADTGEYYSKIMSERRDANPDAAVAASKRIGWTE